MNEEIRHKRLIIMKFHMYDSYFQQGPKEVSLLKRCYQHKMLALNFFANKLVKVALTPVGYKNEITFTRALQFPMVIIKTFLTI